MRSPTLRPAQSADVPLTDKVPGRNVIKICGITCADDARIAVDAGATAIGINVWEKSPRYVAADDAVLIREAVRDQRDVVLVTVNMPWDQLLAACTHIQPDWIQLHGDEPDTLIAQLWSACGVRAYRAIGIADEHDVQRALRASGARVLIDARDDIRRGGTGTAPARVLAQQVCAQRPTILAGGLGVDNVAEAIAACGPVGVDAASQLELPGRRRKDPHKVREFVQAAQRAFLQIGRV